MKRFLSILLTAILLIVSIHPIFATHFCEGKLVGMRIFGEEADCTNGMDHTGNNKYVLQHIDKSCCLTKHLSLKTDDYQYSNNQISIHLPVMESIFFDSGFHYLCLYREPETKRKNILPPIIFQENGREIICSVCRLII